VVRSPILAAVGCPIGREEDAARVCRWDSWDAGQRTLVYTLQSHFQERFEASERERKWEADCTLGGIWR
jgi:hypothetical protein